MSNQIFRNNKKLYSFFDRIEYNSSIGLISGGKVTQASQTQYKVEAGVGQYKDGKYVKWETQILTSNLLEQASGIYVNEDGGIDEEQLDNKTRINKIKLAALGIQAGVAIIGIAQELYPATDRQATILDFMRLFMPLNINGNNFIPNGANLFLNKIEGNIFDMGVNFHTDRDNPDRLNIPASTQTFLLYNLRPLVLTPTPVVIPGFWDNNEVLDTVAINKWTIQRIYIFPSTGQTGIAYGQKVFLTSDAAIAARLTTTYQPAQIFDAGILTTFLIIRGGAVDLTDIGDAEFL